MPSRHRIFLKAFNRDADFVVNRNFKFDGDGKRPGDPFDKSVVPTRRLRLLYDSRKIKMVEGSAPAKQTALAALNASEARARNGAKRSPAVEVPVDKTMPGAESVVIESVEPSTAEQQVFGDAVRDPPPPPVEEQLEQRPPRAQRPARSSRSGKSKSKGKAKGKRPR